MRAGSTAEALVAEYLTGLEWTVLARNVRVGRSELDLVAIDPGPPAMLVVLEVRANRTSRFGIPEESVDRDKLRAVYRGALAIRAAGGLPGVTALPRLPLRVDVVSVEVAPGLGEGVDGTVLRHLRGLIG
jgi:Holliday junction resolvase-like predicted endonuclease